jgi:phosphate/sulfate permease
MSLLIIGLIVLSLIVGTIYRHNILGFWGNVIVSLFLTPLVPVFLNLFSFTQSKNDGDNEKNIEHTFNMKEPIHPADM